MTEAHTGPDEASTPPPFPSGPEVADANTGTTEDVTPEKQITLDDLHVGEDQDETPDGYVRIATPVGYSFTIREDLPAIDSDGIDVPPEVADTIIAISDDINGKVFVVEPETEEV